MTCRSRVPRCLALVAVLLLPAAGRERLAGVIQDPPAFPVDPEVTDALPVDSYSPHYLAGNNVSETWNYVFDFPDGHAVSLQFMLTNIGPGDFTGVVIAYLMAPDGELAMIKNSRHSGLWTDRTDERGPWMEIAYHTLRVEHPSHRIVLDHPDRGKLDLRAETLTPMFRPGPIDFGHGDWYDVTFVAPRLRVTGSVQLPGRERVELPEGRGVALHSVANLSDDRLATSWLRIDTFDAPDQVSLFELMTSQRYGRRRLGFALRFAEDRLVGWSQQYGRRLVETRPDPAKGRYPLVDRLRFGAVRGRRVDGSDEGIDFRGEATLRLLNRNELLEFLNSPVLRFVLRFLSDPILYQYRAEYELVFDFQGSSPSTVRGRGIASLYFLDDPPVVF